ncbi:MAG: hypothetical protein PVH41_11930 [Anaerolineae bacterium]|jgi:hypothetical protein
MNPSSFVSKRVSRTRSITLGAPLASVFPLFGPVRETEWATGWEPEVLYSATGLLEEHMVFRTRSHRAHEPDLTWTVSRYSPDEAVIEYTVFAPGRLWWIAIQCRESAGGDTTRAEITYTYTGLTEEGNAANERALEEMYRHDLRDWEGAINHYLRTGERLEHG